MTREIVEYLAEICKNIPSYHEPIDDNLSPILTVFAKKSHFLSILGKIDERDEPPPPPAPSSPAYKCNYCEAKFDTIEGHEEQFEYNHEGLPPRPHKGEIEEMQANGIEEVDFKGNALE